MQIPSQELMTKDIVTIHVDAVAFYKIDGPLKALCDVEDGDGASSEAAQKLQQQLSVRDQLSRAAFDQVLHDRDEAARNVLAAPCKLTAHWGMIIEAVKFKIIRVDVIDDVSHGPRPGVTSEQKQWPSTTRSVKFVQTA
ncbi:MAG: hypothetical protein ALECFALPRED_001786 [Alectoria fallacina]|uniref:Band 7 domain-containing protein n=1 Tax=Alectoria fallacina TaxID=1903189 RepID=A0A8H3IAZ0_9LECA|nr:MAG: hypothetical protein ALECFALPRED_001786 [Alectoria fallacina]